MWCDRGDAPDDVEDPFFSNNLRTSDVIVLVGWYLPKNNPYSSGDIIDTDHDECGQGFFYPSLQVVGGASAKAAAPAKTFPVMLHFLMKFLSVQY